MDMTRTRSNTRQNHLKLAQQIIEIVLERGMRTGDHLPEQVFSDACGVSRTPIRSSFKLLEEQEIVTRREEEGYFLNVEPERGIANAASRLVDMEDSLAVRILSDRAERRISDVHSVSGLVRRYAAPRSSVLNALKILAIDGVVTQLPGRKWAFQPILDTPKAITESLSIRMTLEPQAILAPGFSMDSQRVGLMRQQMLGLLNRTDGRLSSASFRRLDCEFHSLIAESSGNRFIRGMLLAHQRLRQMTQKDMSVPDFRLRQALEEHLDILDSLERMQLDLAADQMTLHLRRSQIRRPQAANRGLTPLARGGLR
jgi:DNA-binding GntR family transcriptional regulator